MKIANYYDVYVEEPKKTEIHEGIYEYEMPFETRMGNFSMAYPGVVGIFKTATKGSEHTKWYIKYFAKSPEYNNAIWEFYDEMHLEDEGYSTMVFPDFTNYVGGLYCGI